MVFRLRPPVEGHHRASPALITALSGSVLLAAEERNLGGITLMGAGGDEAQDSDPRGIQTPPVWEVACHCGRALRLPARGFGFTDGTAKREQSPFVRKTKSLAAAGGTHQARYIRPLTLTEYCRQRKLLVDSRVVRYLPALREFLDESPLHRGFLFHSSMTGVN